MKPLIISILAVSSFYFFLIFSYEKKEINIENEVFSIVKVSLLNGCGYPGIAKEVMENLITNKNEILDIIAWRNVDRNMFIYNQSIIVIKKRDDQKLDNIIKITGIERKIFALDENIIEDFQVILGKDYKRYFK